MPPIEQARRPLRPPRRFRRRLLIILAAAGLGPLAVWGLLGQSLLEGALAVAPPVGSLLHRAGEALERSGADPRLTEDLRLGELHLAQADLARRRLMERVPLSFLVALLVSAALVGLGAWLFGRRLSRPVEELARAMARYGRGELDHQVRVSGRGDELDYLAVELNRMGRELAIQRERLRRSEALAAWRDTARSLAHDLKNPLTAMRMALGRLVRPGRTSEAVEESVSLLQEELDVLIRMSQSFSEFARLPDPRPRPLDLGSLVEEVAGLYRAESPRAGLEVRTQVRPVVLGDGDQLRRALGNLLRNAIEAASRNGGGTIDVELSRGEDPGRVVIGVRDRGAGLAAPVDGNELMRGLHSSKVAGSRGLGLPIAYKIIHDHGGHLRLEPAHGGGTRAVIELPVAEVPAAPATGNLTAAPTPHPEVRS
jgi:two-component system nitrogen regulation sensor histidine kinase NtrY